MRRGLGLGRGKGYKNLQGRDPYVHGQSARGVKQPQRIGMAVTSRFTGAKGKVILTKPYAVKYDSNGKPMARLSNPKILGSR